MTGHGNVVLSRQEAYEPKACTLKLVAFYTLMTITEWIPFIRVELKKVFPHTEELIEIPANHPIFHQTFDFQGIPKIHEHDGKAAQAFGIYLNGRLVCLYTYETDLSDGWEDANVHNDSESKRKEALEMGANIIQYVFTN